MAFRCVPFAFSLRHRPGVMRARKAFNSTIPQPQGGYDTTGPPMYQQFGIDKSNLSIAILIKDTTVSERRLPRLQVSTKGPASMDDGHHEFFQADGKPTAKKKTNFRVGDQWQSRFCSFIGRAVASCHDLESTIFFIFLEELFLASFTHDRSVRGNPRPFHGRG